MKEGGFKLNRWGVFLDKIGLLHYWVVPIHEGTIPSGIAWEKRDYPIIRGQVIDYPHFTLYNWIDMVRQKICKHDFERLLRVPRDGEFLKPRKIGLVWMDKEVCKKCGKYKK